MKLEQKQINFRTMFYIWAMIWGVAYVLDMFFAKYPIYQYVKIIVLVIILALVVSYKYISKNTNVLMVSTKIEEFIKYFTYAMLIPFLLTIGVDFLLKGDLLQHKKLINLILGIILIIISITGLILNYLTIKLTKDN